MTLSRRYAMGHMKPHAKAVWISNQAMCVDTVARRLAEIINDPNTSDDVIKKHKDQLLHDFIGLMMATQAMFPDVAHKIYGLAASAEGWDELAESLKKEVLHD